MKKPILEKIKSKVNVNNLQVKKYKNAFLIVEDNPADEELVKELLNQAFGGNCSIVCVDKFSKAKEALCHGQFEVLILDMGLPDSSGILSVTILGQLFPELTMVILTGQDDLSLAMKALQCGAQDFLTKNCITSDLLYRSIHYSRERKNIELQLRHANEETTSRNIQLAKQARFDTLTGLPNRSYLYDSGRRVLARAKRYQKEVAMIFLDLNGFKKINDSYGHSNGDLLLIQLAERLKSVVRDSDLLVRLGGDEFVILTYLLDNRADVYPLIKRVLQAFDLPFLIERNQYLINTSVGVAYYPESESLDFLLKNADFAMYKAKKNVGNNVCFFTESMSEQFSLVHKIEQHLESAANNGEFDVVFQPILPSVRTKNEEASVEAFIRWHSPELGHIVNVDFISLAEKGPVINEITQLVIKKSADLLHHLEQRNIPLKTIAINVCASQLEQSNFCDLFLSWLEENKLPVNKVSIELTEHQIIDKANVCQNQFALLRKNGITITLDDFGSGFSSIMHLLSLDIDVLKLDRFLIDKIDTNSRHYALVAGVLKMTQHMDIKVIADGIERVKEYDLIRELGIHGLQGNYIANPMSLNEITEWYLSQQQVRLGG